MIFPPKITQQGLKLNFSFAQFLRSLFSFSEIQYIEPEEKDEHFFINLYT